MVHSGRFNVHGVAFPTRAIPPEIRREGSNMSASERTEALEVNQRAWREALLEVEQARIDYAKLTDDSDVDDGAIGRRWLRLWRAERRRDELIKQSD
jgi:hypothetical protein